MRPSRRLAPGFRLAAAVAIGACERGTESAPPATSGEAAPPPATAALDVSELRNATYNGLQLVPGEITLADGVWEAAPHVEGGAARTRVVFGGSFRIHGDLDADGHDEAAVIVAVSGGGSGSLVHVALMALREGRPRNVATAFLGDRVQVRAGSIAGDALVLDLVQAGPLDAACCPGDLVRRTWRLEGEALVEGEPVAQGRLGPAILGGVEWVLRHEDWELPGASSAGTGGQAAPLEATLRFQDGRAAGSAGCNRYFVPVTAGAQPGDVTLGAAGSTRMMCDTARMALEERFLAQLRGTRKFGFLLGQLALTYEKDGALGSMLFDPRPVPPE